MQLGFIFTIEHGVFSRQTSQYANSSYGHNNNNNNDNLNAIQNGLVYNEQLRSGIRILLRITDFFHSFPFSIAIPHLQNAIPFWAPSNTLPTPLSLPFSRSDSWKISNKPATQFPRCEYPPLPTGASAHSAAWLCPGLLASTAEYSRNIRNQWTNCSSWATESCRTRSRFMKHLIY
jgi:hypothetical protein